MIGKLVLIALVTALCLLACAMVPKATRKADDALRGNPIAVPAESLRDILARRDAIPTHHHLLVNQPAPDFALADPDGKIHNFADLHDGGLLVLIFYNGCRCVSCVRHLSEVNRDLPLFRELGARLAAISSDPPELTREWFQKAGPLGFPVLSDPENQVARAYRVLRGPPGGTRADLFRHGAFIIDRAGVVQWVNVSDAPLRRNSALLFHLAELEGQSPP